jgi:hypothetical protein
MLTEISGFYIITEANKDGSTRQFESDAMIENTGCFVGFVTNDKVIDDSMMSHFESTEPSAHEWLNCIADDDFELI